MSDKEEQFDLDRTVALERKIDALGKRWVIHKQRSNGLMFIRPDPDRVDAVIPSKLQGLWTKIGLLQAQLDLYLNETWDQAEAAKLKAERKAQAAKEVAERNAKQKAQKAKDDAGKTARA
jgi:hypothetical protein